MGSELAGLRSLPLPLLGASGSLGWVAVFRGWAVDSPRQAMTAAAPQQAINSPSTHLRNMAISSEERESGFPKLAPMILWPRETKEGSCGPVTPALQPPGGSPPCKRMPDG